jgi:hypothetical protein
MRMNALERWSSSSTRKTTPPGSARELGRPLGHDWKAVSQWISKGLRGHVIRIPNGNDSISWKFSTKLVESGPAV